MNENRNHKSLAVIIGFYNGNNYLFDQLKSILSQSYKNIKIFIFNDNSPEKIIESIIKSDKNLNPIISIINRDKNQGYAKNFLLGLKDVGSSFDYYAFCDQDDIWEVDKTSEAIKHISEFNQSKPVLYCCRTSYYTKDCSEVIGSSKNFKKEKSFKNALIQNIAGGNTIVMNKEARNLVVKSLICDEYISHDWWCYLLVTAAGGNIIFNSKKSVKYRQHEKNLIQDKFERFKKLFSRTFKSWINVNIKNLKTNKILIKKENLKILQDFTKARNSKNPFVRIKFYFKSGVFRQSSIENLIFIIGIFLGKI